MKTIVILGTSRVESNTLATVKELCPFPEFTLIDLGELRIDPYNYDGTNQPDDFLKVAEQMQAADNIVFATPVYWYAMSGTLKIFFDRLTDLLSEHKAIGKALEGRSTYLISCGSDPKLPEGFEVPFRRTSKYFNMVFEKSFYKGIR